MQQTDIFDFLLDQYKITNPIRLIELFAGIGSQAKALERLGANFAHYKVVEFDKYAIKSYNAIHGTNFETSDITKIHAEDLEISDTDKYDYILTYSFPCFTKDTLVLTSKGFKKIVEIKKDDYVLTHNNQFKKVLCTKKTGNKEVFKINAMSVDELKCTSNHKFYVREKYREGHKNIRKFKEPKWKELRYITKNDYLGIAINKNEIIHSWDGIDFEWKDGRKSRHKNQLSKLMDNHSFWWIIGRYIGDGWIRKQGGIIICCSKKELQEIPTHIRNCKFNYYVVEDRTTYKIHIPLKELDKFVLQFGHGALNKRLTNVIFDLPKDYLKSFIDGYISADGYNNGELYKVSSVSKELIYSLGQCVAKAYQTPYRIYKTIRPKKTTIEGRMVNQNDTYEIVWKTKKCKQDKAFYEDGYIWFPIKDICNYGYEDVYDIEVEDDHSFTANGVIVHNCQDLSIAGKGKGMEKGSGTRSGLLWEVERILNECNELPQVLLMENVPQVHSEKNMEHFKEWMNFLEYKGYQNYWQDLNAKDYGVPQNRNRCFMISILGDYKYEFPQPFELKFRLKDMLEDEVDEKYYLSEKMIEYISANNEKWTGNNDKSLVNKDIASTLNTGEGTRRCDASNYIIPNVKEENADIKSIRKYGIFDTETSKHQAGSVWETDGLAPTLDTMQGGYRQPCIEVKEKTKRGYKEAYEGDGIYINRPHQKRGCVQDGMIQTLKTSCADVGVVVGSTQKNAAINYDGVCPTLTSAMGIGGGHVPMHNYDLRIRKLTPLECFRLMGFDDEDLYKAEKVNSKTQLYKQSGNSIVVNVLEAIFKQLF